MIFLGLLFNRNDEQSIASKSRGCGVQNQVNTFQWNCIDGLYANGVKDLCIMNDLPVGTYPRQYADAVIPPKEWDYNGNKHFQIGSVNLPVLKQFGRYLACKRLIKKSGDKEILIYSAYQPFLKAVRKLDKSYKITLIVPDLPKFYDYAKVGIIRKLMRKLNNRSIEKCMGRVDRFVLFTEPMKEALGVGDRPYTVVEGICTAKPSDVKREASEKKVILYTGSLNKQFGIDVLVDAFGKIPDENYELWICGGGDYQENVKKAAGIDDRIKFYGYVTKDKVCELQAKATVLVNPRQNVGEYTKYSFPSKTMEYLLSGIPVIGYKLSGIPDEYDDYLNYVADNSAESLSQKLHQVCEDCDGRYNEKAKKAVDFVMNEKNPKRQARKILDVVNRT